MEFNEARRNLVSLERIYRPPDKQSQDPEDAGMAPLVTEVTETSPKKKNAGPAGGFSLFFLDAVALLMVGFQ